MTETTLHSLVMVGDIYVQRPDPATVFSHVAERFEAADFVIGNLEGAVCDGGTPWQKGGINVWKADARQMQAIEAGAFDAVSVTNNHIMDFGYDGLAETLANLDAINVRHAGAGDNLAAAHAPAIIEKDGVRIALLAYTSVFVKGWEATEDRPGLAVLRVRTAYEPDYRVGELPGAPPIIRTWAVPADLATLKADIAQASKAADLVICSFHWGISGGYEKLTEYQTEIGRFAVDCGADMVFGHHPHLFQGIEIYQGRPIFYSLGNFTFARHNPAKGQELESIVVDCDITNGKLGEISFRLARADAELRPRFLAEPEIDPVLETLKRRSSAFGTRFIKRGERYVALPAEAQPST